MVTKRGLTVTLLIMTFLVAVFVLSETYFIQEAAGSCSTGYIICDLAMRGARKICNHHGWGSVECANASKEAVNTCITEYILHDN